MEVISRKISELYNDPNNARKHDEKNLKAIKGSLKKFGLQKPIIISIKDIVIAGNGTLEAARQLGWEEIDCVVTSLDKFDATAYAIADNRTAELASWDELILGSTLQSLREDGFDLGEIGFDTSALDDIGVELSEEEKTELAESQSGNGEEGDDAYTKKIKSPIYEPKGPKPPVAELFDTSKTDALLAEIEASSVSEDEKKFLRAAAHRHSVFNYENIAEYYSHSESGTKNLIENSALVIIDFNKAIENGFVVLSEGIAEAYKNENEG